MKHTGIQKLQEEKGLSLLIKTWRLMDLRSIGPMILMKYSRKLDGSSNFLFTLPYYVG
jgi:hypothetical protein